jgi:hypothetical protein
MKPTRRFSPIRGNRKEMEHETLRLLCEQAHCSPSSNTPQLPASEVKAAISAAGGFIDIRNSAPLG